MTFERQDINLNNLNGTAKSAIKSHRGGVECISFQGSGVEWEGRLVKESIPQNAFIIILILSCYPNLINIITVCISWVERLSFEYMVKGI